jgi:8-oxo-dGTP diphosphatase
VIEVVAAVIVHGDDSVLACRRRPERGGLWEFPGGKIEPGESPRDALAREIFEELAVRIEVGDHIVTVEASDLGIRLSSYWARLIESGPTSSTDHDTMRWVRPEELDQLVWAAADIETVRLISSR